MTNVRIIGPTLLVQELAQALKQQGIAGRVYETRSDPSKSRLYIQVADQAAVDLVRVVAAGRGFTGVFELFKSHNPPEKNDE